MSFSLACVGAYPFFAWLAVNKRFFLRTVGRVLSLRVGVTFALVVEVRYGVSSSDRGHVHLPWWQALGWLCVAVP